MALHTAGSEPGGAVAPPAARLEIDSADVLRVVMQFLKEVRELHCRLKTPMQAL